MGFLWHKQEQVSFEEMLDNLESSCHGQALRDWREEGLRGEDEEGEVSAPACAVPYLPLSGGGSERPV